MFVWVTLVFLQQQILDMPKVDRNPYTTSADVELGRKLYAGRCAGCHGPAGDGGKGANLATPVLSRAQDDLGLYRVIRFGLPETEMPSHNMTEREIWQMAAFVRTLGRTEGDNASGDPVRGASLVKGKGACLSCHIIDGKGGQTGPALSDIGQRRSPTYLRNKLLDPSADLSSGFSMVSMMTRSGANVRGIRLNEDTFSIQIREMNGNINSFWKSDLKELSVDQRTVMPSFRERFTPQEITDVVRYLSGLRGQE